MYMCEWTVCVLCELKFDEFPFTAIWLAFELAREALNIMTRVAWRVNAHCITI